MSSYKSISLLINNKLFWKKNVYSIFQLAFKWYLTFMIIQDVQTVRDTKILKLMTEIIWLRLNSLGFDINHGPQSQFKV